MISIRLQKKPLLEVIKEAKVFYTLQFNDIRKKIQKVINDLDLSKINELLDQIGNVFGEENNEIRETLNIFKNLN